MRKKLLILSVALMVLCIAQVAKSETYFGAYKNVFGGELSKKYPNAGTSRTECEKLIEEYANSWAILNQEYGGMPSGGSQLMTTLYCSPNNSKPVKKVYPYHDTDDKSDFWIPKNINPLMMSNQELEEYRIVDDNNFQNNNVYNIRPSVILHKIKKAKEAGRPFIIKDVNDALADYKTILSLERALTDNPGMGYSVENQMGNTPQLPSLTDKQEKQLKTITDEYGLDVFSDQFKRNLKLYRERQEYIKNNTPKAIQGAQKMYNFYNKYLSY